MSTVDSPLANYYIYSPNNSGKRIYSLSRISIHCVAGQMYADSLGYFFQNPNLEASSNYGVGKDGKIGQYMPESYRSWCTSSYDNDNRAITIEVASDSYDPYAVTDAAYKSLIKLVADICKRNKKTKVLWFADKTKSLNYTPKSNEIVLTVHRWFANKSCPGDYLYSRHTDIANQVNKLLAGTEPEPTPIVKPTIEYKVKTKKGWSAAVKDLKSYAGTEGQSILCVAIKPSQGSVKYRVHVKGKGWLPYVTGYNTSDDDNGYAGNGKAIDAIEVYYSTPKTITDQGVYYRAKYRVSPTSSKNYYDWQYDNSKENGQDGYAGCFGKTLDKFQITLV